MSDGANALVKTAAHRQAKHKAETAIKDDASNSPRERCLYPACVENEEERCFRWLTGKCLGPHEPAAGITAKTTAEPLQQRIAELEAQLASVQEPTPDNSASLLLHEIFSLCEHTENAPQVEPKNEHQRGFDAGRRFEAKGIRRAIGDWFQSEFCGGSFMGEPAPAQQPLTFNQRQFIVATCPTHAHVIDAVEAAHDIKEKP